MKKLFALVALAGLGLATVGCEPKPAPAPPATPATPAKPMPGDETPPPDPAPTTPPADKAP